jgi:hypothetical protein
MYQMIRPPVEFQVHVRPIPVFLKLNANSFSLSKVALSLGAGIA